ncbi:ABC transporter permease (plasmid) [Bacillus thuringiensis]|nr:MULTISPECIES: ABC transporter permease [Bacillus cereus group]OTX59362.1 ABC transporter [Bacillus thuringiensis serovar pondicheriensis]QKH22488.1 ABC transporter permease [Bacillus thuringiensis]
MNSLIPQWKAEMKRTCRDIKFMFLIIVLPIAFYLIYSQIFGPQIKISGTNWSAYYMVSMASFGIVGNSITILGTKISAEREKGWNQLLQTTPLSNISYALAKVFTQLMICLVIIILLFFVGHLYANVELPLLSWFKIGVWLWFASLPFAALGIVVGSTGNIAQLLGTLLYLGLSLLGGLWMPIQAMPESMQSIAEWMPTYNFAKPAWDILGNQPFHYKSFFILIGYTILFILIYVGLNKLKKQSTR